MRNENAVREARRPLNQLGLCQTIRSFVIGAGRKIRDYFEVRRVVLLLAAAPTTVNIYTGMHRPRRRVIMRGVPCRSRPQNSLSLESRKEAFACVRTAIALNQHC
jgi:hypothetical protein